MTTLVIHAPRQTAKADNKRSFEDTFRSGVGDSYAIWSRFSRLCHPGCAVVLLSKDEQKRADGTLVKLVPVGKAGNGIQRYNVHIRNLRMVEFGPGDLKQKLNKNGVWGIS